MPNCEFYGCPLLSIVHFRYDRELFKTTTTKLQNDLEGFQSKEATATRNYEILSAEHERIRKKLQSQEQM